MSPQAESYVEKHRVLKHRRGRIARREINNLVAAVGRLIDRGELSYDRDTDELCVTPEGHRKADRMAWWWDRPYRRPV